MPSNDFQDLAKDKETSVRPENNKICNLLIPAWVANGCKELDFQILKNTPNFSGIFTQLPKIVSYFVGSKATKPL